MFGIFEFDVKKLLLVALILALPLIAINLERRDRETGPSWYEAPILWVVNPTQNFFSNMALGISDTTNYYLNLLNVKKENRILKEELAKLKQDIQLAEETNLENHRLKGLLEFIQTSESSLIATKVIAFDLFGEFSSLVINKGALEGIKKGMAVITREGVVGYIMSATNDNAVVLLLTDPNAVIDSIVQRTRARGISEGLFGRDICQLKYLQRTDDVQSGDLIVTSGLDGIFPKGFPLGTVTKVSKKSYGVTQYIEMKPIININRVEEVLVVISPEKTPEKQMTKK